MRLIVASALSPARSASHGIPCGIALIASATVVAPARAEIKLERETPQVWNVSATEATVAWFTSGDGPGDDSAIEFGPTVDGNGTRVTATTRVWPHIRAGGPFRHHVVTITGLQPNTTYYYRTIAGDQALTPTPGTAAEAFHFKTAKAPSDLSPFRFVIVGDGGKGNKYQRSTTWQMEQQAFDFVLHTGDVVYEDSADAEWHLNYYPIYRDLVRNRPWFIAVANHDYLDAPEYHVVSRDHAVKGNRLLRKSEYDAATDKDPAPLVFAPQAGGTAAGYFDNVILPTGSGGNERYYSFDWGGVHIVVLDSNRRFTPSAPGDKQYEWLVKDLAAASDARWTIVNFHHPMIAIGKPEYAYDTESVTKLRRDWHPVFERYGVDLVVTGHDHTYQRTGPIVVDPATGDITRDDDAGIVHLVTGGGGAGVTDQSIVPAPTWHQVFSKRHHFLTVDVTADTLTITALADADIHLPGVTEKKGIGGPAETVDTVTLKHRQRKIAQP